MTMLIAFLQQAATPPAPWSVLSAGAIIALLSGAVGYGIVKQKGDTAAGNIEKLGKEMRDGFTGVNTDLRALEMEVGNLRVQVGEIRGERAAEQRQRRRDDVA